MQKNRFEIVKEMVSISDVIRKRYGRRLGRNNMMHAFWRGDRTPSVSVNNEKNLWYDHGTGEGGSVIELVMHAENISALQAVDILMHDYAHVQTTKAYVAPDLSREERNSILVKGVNRVISHHGLLGYLASRHIDSNAYAGLCVEVAFSFARNPDKVFTAIGFPNRRGGYELRNPWFKGCINKDISVICNGGSQVVVFEGFFDFLTYAQTDSYRQLRPDIVVLNSVAMSKRAIEYIREKGYPEVWLCLDNDKMGRRKTAEITEALPDVKIFDLMLWTLNRHPALTRCKDYNEIAAQWREIKDKRGVGK